MKRLTRQTLARGTREPLLHFAVLGLGLFALHRLVADRQSPPETVVIHADAEQRVTEQFVAMHGREPSQAELDGLLGELIDEELLYREGLALGLDRKDPIVRRRIVQRMRFVLEDAAAVEPTDEQLRLHLRENPERYAGPEQFDVRHVFFSDSRPDAEARARACATREGQDCDGDAFAHGNALRGVTAPQLDADWGKGPGAAVEHASVGNWDAMQSGLGWHAFVVERRFRSSAELERVRERVAEDWRAEQRDAERVMLRLRDKYEVRREAGA